MRSSLLRHLESLSIALAAACLWSCAHPPAERRGALQQLVTSKTFSIGLQTLRAAVLHKFTEAPHAIPLPFAKMKAIKLEPPNYPADWLATWTDPGGFLEPYKRIPGPLRVNDLLIEEPIGDLYWPSEYSTAVGPAKFRCGFILHFAQRDPLATEVQVYEKVPEIWIGERWDFAHHGFGFGKFRDIRLVEPTVKDRTELLDVLSEIARAQ